MVVEGFCKNETIMAAEIDKPLQPPEIVCESLVGSPPIKLQACSTLVSAVSHAAVMVALGMIAVGARFSSDTSALTMEVVETPEEYELQVLDEPKVEVSFSDTTGPASSTSMIASAAATTDLEVKDPTKTVAFSHLAHSQDRFGDDLLESVLSNPLSELSSQASGSSSDEGTANFFGTVANGKRFVYILDYSTSMQEVDRYGRSRFQVAASELLRSVEQLSDDQEFFVVLFSYQTRLMFDLQLAEAQTVLASETNVGLLRSWLEQVRLAPGTDPRMGMVAAQKLKPDAIFLLTDGEFNGRNSVNRGLIPGNPRIERIIKIHGNPSPPVHSIGFENRKFANRMRTLSESTGGTFRYFER